jgi:hypothetical protein
MRIKLEGVQSNDVPIIEAEIQSLLLDKSVETANCDEIIAIGRGTLLPMLEKKGNNKMLEKARAKRHEYYLLLLNHTHWRLRVIPLPYRPVHRSLAMAA